MQERPTVSDHGLDALVVRFGATVSEPANRAALAFRAALDRASLPGIEETASALTSVFVRFDPRAVPHDEMARHLRALVDDTDWFTADLGTTRRLWRIPTVYGGSHGPQLDEAAQLAGVSPDEAVRELSQARVRVLAIGFAPGQPYLGELPKTWALPRQTGLTPEVPEGALTTAVRQFVLFANPSPTGWRHIGQTAFRCFRPEAADPFPLRPGDEVLFEAIAPDLLDRIRRDDAQGGGATARPL
jgi:KipI family sensor histidine kinase inhibitor